MLTMPNTSPGRKNTAPDKYTVTANNQVKPNFQSSAYQEDARLAHKRRMGYNPLEASKNKMKFDHPTSKYAQEDLQTLPIEQPFSRNIAPFNPSKSAVNIRPSRFEGKDPNRF